MRITAQAKQETRDRIEEAGRRFFAKKGLDATTTRELAGAAGIAVGTFFNYFPSKEALAVHLLADAVRTHEPDARESTHRGDSIEEDLFKLIVTEMRALEPCHDWLGEALEAASATASCAWPDAQPASAPEFQLHHLDAVCGVLRTHGVPMPLDAVTLHLYWTLYIGVLAFWARDESPKQQQTLALLDRTTRLFAASLREGLSTQEAD